MSRKNIPSEKEELEKPKTDNSIWMETNWLISPIGMPPEVNLRKRKKPSLTDFNYIRETPTC